MCNITAHSDGYGFVSVILSVSFFLSLFLVLLTRDSQILKIEEM
jgi:hypothetical protein